MHFISSQKLVFVFKIVAFLCPNFFGHIGKWFDKKITSVSKFMTLSSVKQMITTRRMSNISRSKDNKVYDIMNCETNNYNTQNVQYLKK